MNGRTILVTMAISLSLLTSGLAWRQSRHPHPAAAASTEVEAAVADLTNEVRVLRAEVAAWRAERNGAIRQTALEQAAREVAVAEASAGTAAPPDNTVQLDTRLAEEPTDAAWSAEAVTKIRAAFAAHLPKANVSEIRCGSTLCRVVVRHDEGDDIMTRPMALIAAPPFNEGSMVRREPTATTVFTLREGRQPPVVATQ
jgi:hypothetical protein